MNQKLIKSFLLGSLSLATLVPTGVAGWKVFAAKGETKINVEVPELPKATSSPTGTPKPEEVREQAVLGTSTSVDAASPTPSIEPSASPSPSVSPTVSPSPSASDFPVASSIGTGASLGEDDRVEVKEVEHHDTEVKVGVTQSAHLED